MTEPVTRLVAGGARRARPRGAPTAATAAASASRSRTCRRSRRTSTRRSTCRGSAPYASTSPTAGRSARSSTPPRSASRSCPARPARWPSWASGSARRDGAARGRHPTEPTLSALSFVVFIAARATAATPATRRSSHRAAWTARRPAPRPPPGWPCSRRGADRDGEAFVNESVIDTRLVGRIARRTRSAASTRRPRDHRPRLDHRVHHFMLDPDDPFPEGFPLADTWGAGL